MTGINTPTEPLGEEAAPREMSVWAASSDHGRGEGDEATRLGCGRAPFAPKSPKPGRRRTAPCLDPGPARNGG